MFGSVRDGDGSKDSFRLHVCASQLDVARLDSQVRVVHSYIFLRNTYIYIYDQSFI
jgi:hypothetical protein